MSDKNYSLGVDRVRQQPKYTNKPRGTVFHERREGNKAASYVNDGNLLLRVSCSATAGDFDDDIPYGIAVSIEVGVDSSIAVYEEIRSLVLTRITTPTN